MAETFTYDLFLSHSAKDKPVVRELAERLKRGRLSRVWLDEWEIQPGEMISLKIEQGLEKSRTLVLCMSKNAFASEWVTLERHTALFCDRPMQGVPSRRSKTVILRIGGIKQTLNSTFLIAPQNRS